MSSLSDVSNVSWNADGRGASQWLESRSHETDICRQIYTVYNIDVKVDT